MKDHNKGYKDGFEKGLIDGRKESLKKVVEWLRANGYRPTATDEWALAWDKWQALLEEIKND